VLSLEFSPARVRAFLEEITKLKASDFPYPDSEEALLLIEKVFLGFLDRLEKLDTKSDPQTIRAACVAEVAGLFDYLPILGFIVRSTNTRNAFETYGPVLRLCQQILGPNTKLLISSEWEYSPFTYARVTHLPNYVLIGLPAHESSNPLLLPLAGHELGHTIWADRNILGEFAKKIETSIVSQITGPRWAEFQDLHPDVQETAEVTEDFIVQQAWLPAADWAARQAEETFCDMIGLRIFGESYLYAFAYLLSPRLVGVRSVIYPKFRRRVDDLINAAKAFGVAVPEKYSDLFEDFNEPPDYERNKRFLLSLADQAAEKQTSEVVELANKIVRDANVELPSKDKADALYKDFELIAPAQSALCLANILNAGWRAFNDQALWAGISQVRSGKAVLREILLKSIEVFEYEQIVNSP
jgi:hypothetical protein